MGDDTHPVLRGFNDEQRSGVEIQADALNTILNGSVTRILKIGRNYYFSLSRGGASSTCYTKGNGSGSSLF